MTHIPYEECADVEAELDRLREDNKANAEALERTMDELADERDENARLRENEAHHQDQLKFWKQSYARMRRQAETFESLAERLRAKPAECAHTYAVVIAGDTLCRQCGEPIVEEMGG